LKENKGDMIMAALHITKENFDEVVLKSEVPVLVDFWAPWCGPCRMLTPVIEELAEEVTTAKIGKINVDEEPELAQKFRVMTIPTLIVFKDGKEAHTSIGVSPKAEIIKMLEA
jgi:thioredoxin 1